MTEILQAATGTKLPIWAKLTSSGMGILFAGIGMSRFLTGGPMREVFIPIFVGSVMIYVSGYERKLYMDSDGVWRDTSFWGKSKLEHIKWDEIADVRVILNKGKRIYVIMHGLKQMWPLTFNREQTEKVIEVLTEHIAEEDIKIER